MKLLLADLRALANLPTTRLGRRTGFAMLSGLLLLTLMSWWTADTLVGNPELLRQLLRGRGEQALRGLCGHGLMICPMVATWLGLALAQRQLFDTPELHLWRTAPIAPIRGPLQILLRALFVSLLWSSALAGPFLIALLRRSPAPPLAYALVPLAIASCTAPVLALLLAVQIVMVRILAGRWLRLVLTTIAALASVGFTIWLLLSLFRSGSERSAEIEAAATERSLPMTVDAAATMLAEAAGGTLTSAHVLPVFGWLLAAIAVFLACTPLHARAHERHLESYRPLWRRNGRRWPVSVAGTIRRKEFAQVLQQPGTLVGFLVFAVLVYAFARDQVLVDGLLQHHRVPLEARKLAAMLTWWFLAVLLVLYAHMGRLALWDGAQWPLYMASPTPAGAILRGKLQAIAVLLLWPLMLVAVIGSHQLQVATGTMLWFVAFALAGTVLALGVVATVGTWPRLMRPDAEGQILQGGRSFLAAMVMVLLFQLTLMPAMMAWSLLVLRAQQTGVLNFAQVESLLPWALAAAATYALLIGLAGVLLGTRHYRRLLSPR